MNISTFSDAPASLLICAAGSTDFGFPGGFRTAFEVTADATTTVPVPASAVLMLTGLGGLLVQARRKLA